MVSSITTQKALTYEKARAEFFVRCADEITTAVDSLNESIVRSSRSSQELTRKVFWLNVILTIATTVGAVVAVIGFIKR